MLLKKSENNTSRQSKCASYSQIMLVANTITIFDVAINPSLIGITTLTICLLGTLVIYFRRDLSDFFKAVTKFSRSHKITSYAVIIWSIFILLEALASPAYAQFFQSAESWMTAQFTGTGEAITLAFNVLRGLFILYLGISLVRVIQAARQDEDWQNLARTPMIILIAVTMGDILANLIIGGGG